jgi:pimeloyl-ACP methyl ester carboxylesterase
MLVAQYYKEGLTPTLVALLPLLALQVYAELNNSLQLQYLVAILGGVLHFVPLKVYWLPQPVRAVGFREDYSLEGGLHYVEFHPLEGEVRLRSMKWHAGREIAKMLEYKGLTNRVIRKLGHLILSYVDHYHLKVGEGSEKTTDSAIAFCHGRGGTPFMYSSYLMHFAGLGFRVGAGQHTEVSKTDLVGKEEIKRYREREVQARAAEFYQVILTAGKGKQRLVLMGHSYGCATLIQAYHTL